MRPDRGCLARLVKVDHRAGPRGGRTPARPRAGNGRTGDSFPVCTVPGRTALGVSLGVTPWEPCSQPNVVDGRADPAHPGGAMFLDRAPSAADVGAPPCRRRPRQHLPLSTLRPRGRDAPGVVARTGPGAKSSRSPGPVGVPGCACEDAPRTTDLLGNANHAAGVTDRYRPCAAKGSTRRNAQEWRATETVVRHRGMAQPYGPPGRRSCSLPVQLPHSWRTWCSLGDPTRSGQPCMRTKGPSRDRRNRTRRADEQAEIHRTGPRPRRRRAPPGSWPGPDCDGSSVPGPLASPVGWAVSPRVSPANRSTPPTRG